MLYRDIAKVLSYYLFILAGMLGLPLLLGIYYLVFSTSDVHPQHHTVGEFLIAILITLAAGGGLYYYGKGSKGQLYRREAFLLVVSIWFATPLFAGLPFYLSGTLGPLQSYFEASSGFSTTGATTMHAKKFDPITGKEIPIQKVFCGAHTSVYSFYGTVDPVRDPETGQILYEGVEAVSKALLFWRSFTQWLGGVGIIVLFVAVLPALGVGGKTLFQAEVPGPVKEGLTPRIKEAALQLWKIYFGLTLIQVMMLVFFNPSMSWFEAWTVTFSTISTGGFSVLNQSVGGFENEATEWIVMTFMVLGSVNFAIYFYSLRGKIYRMFEPEFFLYIALLGFSCCVAAWFLVGTSKELLTGELGDVFTIKESIRYGFFQIISAQTTTGYVTANYDIWPYTVQALMLLVMFLGGMSGSTAGGMKIVRHYMLFRVAQYKVESLFRPENVRRFSIGAREVSSSVAVTTLVYFLIVIFTAVFATFVFILDGIDPQTSISLSTLMINNIGIGFQMAAPTESCAFLSNFSLIFSSILMVMGRLEFFAVFTVLVPAFWRQNS